MSIWESIILGVIQGLTEFLPVSSSGHLELANYLFGIKEPSNLQFTMALHAGTVLSTVVVFWRELARLFRGFFKFQMNDETKFIINILISLVPIAFVGLMFSEQIEALFTNNIRMVGVMLLVTAALLIFAHKSKPKQKNITPKSALIIGISQAIAIVPGLSRSGTTISTGLIMGVKREEVSKFSFLMVLLPIIGMNLLEIVKMPTIESSMNIWPTIAGFMTAFVVGTLACRWMIRVVNRGKLIWFSLYCVVVGLGAIAMSVVN